MGYVQKYHLKYVTRLFVLCASLFLVHGCYIPNNFALDLRITGQGRFALRYEGQLVENNLASPEDNGQDKNPVDYINNLKRYNGFKTIDYVGKGVFNVSFLKRGDLRELITYSFIDQNNRILTMVHSNPKEIIIQGNLLPKGFQSKMKYMKGIARVWTNAHVIYTNADRIVEGKIVRYEWDMTATRKTVPKMIIAAS